MWGFTKKRFFVTLGLSLVVWLGSFLIQAVVTYKNYIGTFSSGCQVTGYPIDICSFSSPSRYPAILIIIINLFFWYWIIHLLWSFFIPPKDK
jgi:hypothetical protein